MLRQSGNNRRRLIPSLLLLVLALAAFSPTATLYAQADIGLSGTFHQQIFELPQGTEISNPSIYVVVFNRSTEELNVQVLSEAPFGVELLFDHTTFPLPPGGEQKVYITVKVTDDAIPGEYGVRVTAQATPKELGGVVIATASAQKASLTVTGEAAWVHARVVSPDGTPIKAQVKLFKIIEDRLNELALSETGTLEIKVSPGLYKVSAYIAARTLAEETVEVKSGETKEITLTVRTVYFEQFGIEPNYAPDTGDLTFTRMVYTLNNLYQPVDNIEVLLVVTLDDKPLEQVALLSLSRLDMGRTGGSYRYIPADEWKTGNYSFKLELYIEEEFYTDSSEEELLVTLPAALLGFNIMWWIAGGAAIILIALLLTLTARRRARRYTLTINTTPAEGGLVMLSPEPDSNGRYVHGQEVTLTAVPNEGYAFAGWSGNITATTNPITITMDADKSVTATFSQ